MTACELLAQLMALTDGSLQVVLEDTSGNVYGIQEVYVSTEHGTVTLIAENSGHFD